MDRNKLKEETDFINSLHITQQMKDQLNEYLLTQWILYSEDSPWNNEGNTTEEINVANTLVKISEEGISNKWSGEHTVFNDVGKVSKKRYNLRPR
jgi:hypothetical protein